MSAVLLLIGCLDRTPNTYHSAGVRSGTATSTSTLSGTTSERALRGTAPQRRPRHDAHRPRRQLLPAAREKAPRYELATPDRIWRHFLDDTGTVSVKDDHVRVDLALRTYTPVLIDAGFPELDLEVPWWEGRKLRFGFPPR